MTADTHDYAGRETTLPPGRPPVDGGEARTGPTSTDAPARTDQRHQAAASLRTARLDRGWSLDQLSDRTRISVTRLAEIEQGHVDNCGAAVYARGHVRAIAGTLQLDPQPLLDALAAYPAPAPPPGDTSARIHRPAVALTFLALCLLTLVGLGLALS